MDSLLATTVNNSELSCNKPTKNLKNKFKWTNKYELCLLKNMLSYKPAGIHKHIHMAIIRKNVSENLKLKMTTDCLWEFVNSKWNIAAADKVESLPFNNDQKAYVISDEYAPLVAIVKKKNMEKQSLINENFKKKLTGSSKTRSKSNSLSSVESNEAVHKLSDSIHPVKNSEVRSDEVLSSRRSLRTNDKLEDKEFVDDSLNKKRMLRVHSSFEEDKKSKDLKQLSTKKCNQSIDSEKNKQISNARGLKRKSRNVSESSFNSDNIKQPRSSRSNVTELVSDGSSRSVTPEILRSKSNRSVTPEIINRKSNLRSGDKDQKNKPTVEKHLNRSGQSLTDSKIKHEKSEKQTTKLAPKQSTLTKNETTSKTKNKTRITADYFVVQQSPEIQSMGRRSYNKS